MRRIRDGLMVLVLAAALAQGAAGEELCGVNPTLDDLERVEAAFNSSPMPKELAKAVAIPVSLNLITNGRQGNYSDAVILLMMNNLNAGFAGTPFQFRLTKFRRVNNKKWFQDCRFFTANHTAMTKKLALDPRYYLNIYVCQTDRLGYGSLPGFPFPANDKRQSVLLHPGALPHGLGDERYSYYGLTAVHEVGHYLGLWHTFNGGCAGGDEVDDTPPQDSPTYSCDSFDTCPEPGRDDTFNFMNYAEDKCWNHFTVGQVVRMIQITSAFRPGLVR